PDNEPAAQIATPDPFAALEGRDYDPITACSDILERDPKNETALLQRAEAFAKNNDLDGAIADYTVALQVAPKATTFFQRGLQYTARGDHEAAVRDYTEAIRLDPTCAGAFSKR